MLKCRLLGVRNMTLFDAHKGNSTHPTEAFARTLDSQKAHEQQNKKRRMLKTRSQKKGVHTCAAHQRPTKGARTKLKRRMLNSLAKKWRTSNKQKDNALDTTRGAPKRYKTKL